MWPGVSMRLMTQPRHCAVMAADTMVMPRSRSCSIQSVTVVPSSTEPSLWVRPVWKRMRSVAVVLPASMCAMTPMLRSPARAGCAAAAAGARSFTALGLSAIPLVRPAPPRNERRARPSVGLGPSILRGGGGAARCSTQSPGSRLRAAASSSKRRRAAPASTRTHSPCAWSYQNPGGLACPVETMRSMRRPGRVRRSLHCSCAAVHGRAARRLVVTSRMFASVFQPRRNPAAAARVSRNACGRSMNSARLYRSDAGNKADSGAISQIGTGGLEYNDVLLD